MFYRLFNVGKKAFWSNWLHTYRTTVHSVASTRPPISSRIEPLSGRSIRPCFPWDNNSWCSRSTQVSLDIGYDHQNSATFFPPKKGYNGWGYPSIIFILRRAPCWGMRVWAALKWYTFLWRTMRNWLSREWAIDSFVQYRFMHSDHWRHSHGHM